ncbi:ornithine cyclodeaminase/alanine dehydrogenase-like protein (mu-crystallin family) [Streptacidiphilus sp. MAP12-16]|uniref:ornithine cyclodeaminase family protein n=1 Tax=Streptacidiphilus sp. MAP12-16 TaxID=3156300 RepID=UPI003515FC34
MTPATRGDFATLPVIGAEGLAELLDESAAVDAIEAALLGGLDPASSGPARTRVPVPAGELLLMPAQFGGYAAVKIAGLAPGNASRGLPTVTGGCLLLDADTLQPLALLDGAALTALRTPAVSALAARHLAWPGATRLTLFGTGPQAHGHLRALAATTPTLRQVTVVGRNQERARALAHQATALGLSARLGSAEDVKDADLVCCCTSAREPLFDSELLASEATVLAVGSHEPEARETDTALVRRSTVVVEEAAIALQEAGDLLIPIAEGAFSAGQIAGDLAELVTGGLILPAGQPRLFKAVGMAWEDLAVAAAAYENLSR